MEVKRCFVISDYIAHQKYFKKGVKTTNELEYFKQLVKVKMVIMKLPEMMLDMIIKGMDVKRFKAYKKMQWYMGIVKTNEVGVWKKAGGLRLAWTRGSLEETGRLVARALQEKSGQLSRRSRMAIPGILKNSLSIIQKEKYLLPIILTGSTRARKGLKKMNGDIDDGCMRSIALAVSGKKTIKAYIGKK